LAMASSLDGDGRREPSKLSCILYVRQRWYIWCGGIRAHGETNALRKDSARLPSARSSCPSNWIQRGGHRSWCHQ
jgi:hypothetical protein